MLDPDHLLFDLASLSALASPLPHLTVRVQDDREHRRVAELLREAVGPVPHAERWEAHPGSHEVRVRLPGLDMATWLSLSHALSHAAGWFSLVPGDLPPFEDAVAEGVLVEDRISPGALVARRWATLDGEPLTRWDVARHPATREIVAPIRAELVEALARHGVDDERTRVIVRRWDGRTGLELVFPSLTEAAARDAALARLSDVVVARAGHLALRVAPDVTWSDGPHGLVVHLWFVRRHLPGLPVGHAGSAASPWVPPGDWTPDANAVGLVAPARHDRLVAEAQRAHPALRGLPPRWLPRRSAWRFAPTWHAQPPLQPGITGLLCVPALPEALLDGTGAVLPYVHRGLQRWFVRHHHTWRDRDLLPTVQPRAADPEDHRWAAWVVQVLDEVDVDPDPDVGDSWFQPVVHARSAGVALHFSAASAGSELKYRRLLDALGALPAEVSGYAPVAFHARRLTVQLWRADAPAPETWA